MSFRVEHRVPGNLLGIGALLAGRGDRQFENAQLENAQKERQIASLGQGISQIGQAATTAISANKAQQDSLERIRLGSQESAQLNEQRARERFVSSQVQQSNKLLQMPPHASAEIYTNTQEIARIAADESIPEVQQRQMIEELTLQNRAIEQANPPPKPPTISDQEAAGQIKFYPDKGVMIAPKNYAVRSLPSTGTVKFSDWMSAVNDESARLQAFGGMDPNSANIQAQANVDKMLSVYRESRGTPVTGNVKRPLLDQASGLGRGSAGGAGAPAGGGAGATGEAPAGLSPVDRPDIARAAAPREALMEDFTRSADFLTNSLDNMKSVLGVDDVSDPTTWHDKTLGELSQVASRISELGQTLFPADSLASAGLSDDELQKLKELGMIVSRIIEERNRRAREGISSSDSDNGDE